MHTSFPGSVKEPLGKANILVSPKKGPAAKKVDTSYIIFLIHFQRPRNYSLGELFYAEHLEWFLSKNIILLSLQSLLSII